MLYYFSEKIKHGLNIVLSAVICLVCKILKYSLYAVLISLGIWVIYLICKNFQEQPYTGIIVALVMLGAWVYEQIKAIVYRS